MAKKTPALKIVKGYYRCDYYRPDGKRSTMSFGPVSGERPADEVYTAFGKWLKLYSEQPHHVANFKSPYEAIEKIANPAAGTTIGSFIDQYVAWIKQFLPPPRDRKIHPTIERLNRLKKFMEPYLGWEVREFRQEQLLQLQADLATHQYVFQPGSQPHNYTRTAINHLINELRKMWSWGIGRGITTDREYRLLMEVRTVRPGQKINGTVVKDTVKRPQVTIEEVQKLAANLNGTRADLLWVLWHTGMRPDEACRMRPIDIIRGDPDCWLYIPGSDAGPVGDHKTSYYGRLHVIPLAGAAQEIIKRRVTDWTSMKYVFSPGESLREWRDSKLVNRETPMSCGNHVGSHRQEHPMITPGERFKPGAVNSAFKRVCVRLGIRPFTPYDLRRSAATRVRALVDKEAAKALLGHASTRVTDVYLLDEVAQAVKVAKQIAQ